MFCLLVFNHNITMGEDLVNTICNHSPPVGYGCSPFYEGDYVAISSLFVVSPIVWRVMVYDAVICVLSKSAFIPLRKGKQLLCKMYFCSFKLCMSLFDFL